MTPEPQKEHQWLQKFVGEWTFDAEAFMTPNGEPMKHSGMESVRSLGGLWILGEGRGEMPGCGSATMILSLGYNPQTKRFIGTWIGSMMTHLWVYDGSLDEAGNVLTLDTEGPDMAGEGKLAPYRDVVEFKSDDHRILRSQTPAADGGWRTFMTAHYRRKE